MRKKVYHLSTCSTCQRILKQWGADASFELQDIKTQRITDVQLAEMAKEAGSYEALFSRRATKFKEMKLGEKTLNEADYKELILEEYTFLRRPVLWVGNQLFVGNHAKVVEAGAQALKELGK